MTKKEYLAQFQTALDELKIEDQEEIITEIETHFIEEKKAGLTTATIIKKLGQPKTLAKTYLLENTVNDYKKTGSANSLWRAILLTLSLGFINLTFILPFVIAIYMVLIAFFMVGLSIILAVILITFFPQLTSLSTQNLVQILPMASYILYILGLILLGSGVSILSLVGIKKFTQLLWLYIKTNLNIIRGK